MFRRIVAQTVAVRARTFATTKVVRAGAFTAFIKKAYSDKAILAQLKDLPITQRGKVLGKLYRALPATEKAALAAAGKKIKFVRKQKATKTGAKRAPSAYNKFVKAKSALPAIKALPIRQRMAAIAKLWNSQ